MSCHLITCQLSGADKTSQLCVNNRLQLKILEDVAYRCDPNIDIKSIQQTLDLENTTSTSELFWLA